nr:immunoglobulin heavy chain junction region [Mus musculus]NSM07169.1 immunoglobulin heavy chain junction region [Mus musculus]NSM08837.1 immunoglobulin heavy chain junction region [Mus musculus]NSM08928.1 immunoglobulin heavy chain junction region [Mus musculus]NSM09781.1 immunoglobulin heavy chain junction region [Mus musculus]
CSRGGLYYDYDGCAMDYW